MPVDHDPDAPGIQDICPIDGEAKRILTSITDGVGFPIPNPDLGTITFPDFTVPDFDLPVQIGNADLTQVQLEGAGTFDVFMRAIALHMDREFKGGRITGAEYAKTYTALVQGAMGQAVQFLLGKDAAYWQAIAAQQQAKLVTAQLVAAQVELATAKVNLALVQNQANNARAEYALTVARLATEEVNYCTAKYNLNNILPTQTALIEQNTANALAQHAVIVEQEKLTKEQTETQRAQTMDTRTDGVTTIEGAIGKQKDLQAQQIISYQRDAEVKAGKMWVDAWITMKTIDEGLMAPVNFTNVKVDEVLAAIKANNAI
jgi:hypothetical protein